MMISIFVMVIFCSTYCHRLPVLQAYYSFALLPIVDFLPNSTHPFSSAATLYTYEPFLCLRTYTNSMTVFFLTKAVSSWPDLWTSWLVSFLPVNIL
uniref:Putative secreted protein n=1 Tax=Rhipicephalus microplus TaxID=6941 RepID=A0A6M2DA27_RHIMP